MNEVLRTALRTAIRAPSDAEALAALLAAWPGSRWPEIGDAIDRLSDRTCRRLPPAPRADEAFIAAFEAADQARWGPFFRAALGRGKLAAVAQRLEAIVERAGTDPRLGRVLLGALSSRTVQEAVGPARLVAWASRLGDPRIASAFASYRSRPAVARRWADVPQVTIEPAALPSASQIELAARFASLGRGPREPELEALLEAVYASPESVAARLVYADRLQELGDAHGEFVALQCRAGAAAQQRARALVDDYGPLWLGVLAPALDPGGLVYEGGFPAKGVLSRTAAVLRAVGHPAWSTFTTLRWPRQSVRESAALSLVSHPAMRGLQHLQTPVSVAGALRLARAPHVLPLTSLEIDSDGGWERRLSTASCTVAEGLPRLRNLTFTGRFDLPNLRSAVKVLGASRLTQITVSGGLNMAAAVFDDARAQGLSVEVRGGLRRLRVGVDQLVAVWSHRDDPSVLEALQTLPSGAFERVNLRPGSRLSGAERLLLRRLKARLLAPRE